MNSTSIAHKSIFGEYKSGEDRVTAALLHIFRIGGPELMNSVFEDLNIELDAQVNTQVKKKGAKSRPDGELAANYHVYIESKIRPWDINKEHNIEQLRNHLRLIEKDGSALIFITADKEKPAELPEREDVYWTTWKEITRRLKMYVPPFNKDVIGFLADQFNLLVDNVVFSNLDESTDDNRVLIVGGRYAENIALQYGFYSCQANRNFRTSRYLAFYYDKRVSSVFEIEGSPIQVKSLEDVSHLLPVDYTLTDEDRKPHTFVRLKKVPILNEPITHE